MRALPVLFFLSSLTLPLLAQEEPDSGPTFAEALAAVRENPKLLLDFSHRRPLRVVGYEEQKLVEQGVGPIVADEKQSWSVRATALSMIRFGGKRAIHFRKLREALHYGKPSPTAAEMLKGFELLSRSHLRNGYWQDWFLRLLRPYGGVSGFVEAHGSRCSATLVDRLLEPGAKQTPKLDRAAARVLLEAMDKEVAHLAGRFICHRSRDADLLFEVAVLDWVYPYFPSINHAVEHLPFRPATSPSDSKQKREMRVASAAATMGLSEFILFQSEAPDWIYDTKYQAMLKLRNLGGAALSEQQLARLDARSLVGTWDEDLSRVAFRYQLLRLLEKRGLLRDDQIVTFIERVVERKKNGRPQADSGLLLAFELIEQTEIAPEKVEPRVRVELWKLAPGYPSARMLASLSSRLPDAEGRAFARRSLFETLPAAVAIHDTSGEDFSTVRSGLIYLPFGNCALGFQKESRGRTSSRERCLTSWVEKLRLLGIEAEMRTRIEASTEIGEPTRAALLALLDG